MLLLWTLVAIGAGQPQAAEICQLQDETSMMQLSGRLVPGRRGVDLAASEGQKLQDVYQDTMTEQIAHHLVSEFGSKHSRDSKRAPGAPTWSGSQPGIWTDAQCPNIENELLTLADCQELCEQSQGCTGINHNEMTNDCILRKCSIPSPKPQGQQSGYSAFTLSGGSVEGSPSKEPHPSEAADAKSIAQLVIAALITTTSLTPVSVAEGIIAALASTAAATTAPPTMLITAAPTIAPTTAAATTAAPTVTPTTAAPTLPPTVAPTSAPTLAPTAAPTTPAPRPPPKYYTPFTPAVQTNKVGNCQGANQPHGNGGCNSQCGQFPGHSKFYDTDIGCFSDEKKARAEMAQRAATTPTKACVDISGTYISTTQAGHTVVLEQTGCTGKALSPDGWAYTVSGNTATISSGVTGHITISNGKITIAWSNGFMYTPKAELLVSGMELGELNGIYRRMSASELGSFKPSPTPWASSTQLMYKDATNWKIVTKSKMAKVLGAGSKDASAWTTCDAPSQDCGSGQWTEWRPLAGGKWGSKPTAGQSKVQDR